MQNSELEFTTVQLFSVYIVCIQPIVIVELHMMQEEEIKR